MNCPFCQKELIKDKDGSLVCHCGAEPKIVNLTVDYYTPDYYIIYINHKDYYFGLCFESGSAEIYTAGMESVDNHQIALIASPNLCLEAAAELLKRYANLKIFS